MINENLKIVETKKPKLLVIGYARHGKDTVCELLRDHFHYKFVSSSFFAAEKVVYPVLQQKYGYQSLQECYDDRSNHRSEWFDLIAAYNYPDPARLAKEMLEEHDIYCGMRNRLELQACEKQDLFDEIIWVDASVRGVQAEDVSSCTVSKHDASYYLFNNGTLSDLECAVKEMHKVFNFNKQG